jgi:polar amino acid transport system substrate-binding protein
MYSQITSFRHRDLFSEIIQSICIWPVGMKKTIIILVGLLVLLSIVLLWIRSSPFVIDNSLDQIKSRGVLRIGYAVEAPYAFIDENGQITGESPELAKIISQKLGIPRVEFIQTEFGLLISGLQDNDYDVIAAGLFITPERARLVAFSEPTFHVQEGMLVQHDNPHKLHSYQDVLDSSEVKVAVIDQSVEQKTLTAIGVPEERLTAVPDALTGMVAVETGLVDSLALSSITIQWMELHEQLGKTEMTRPFAQSEYAISHRLGYGGFAFRAQDRQFLNAWNKAMIGFIGSEDHIRLIEQFGFSYAELPGTMTTLGVITP